ncbi:MAG: thioredoxin domain-containing protein [Gemmatimonadota bacterium]
MTHGANRLAGEKSPYLLQHAHNPVDWYPWGDEALERARREDRPIFLSIGYATCHWCHVMERESFEDPDVAELLNRWFVSVKVDREERPDIDSVYMKACQLMTGTGGWPLTLIMTPDLKPFFAGTYFPKHGRHGRPGMLDLLPGLSSVWAERREEVLHSANRVVEALREPPRGGASGAGGPGLGASGAGGPSLGEEVLSHAFTALASQYDGLNGGFGRAPKFAMPHSLLFLLRYWKRTGRPEPLEMVEETLRAMRRGGIYDHVGFGFHRYSTDARWFVPHFEKMLYDQALLALAYTEAFQATGRPEHRAAAREILTYVLRDLRDPAGGFHSAEDADSEGVEGKFYVWRADELARVLGEQDAALASRVYQVEARGNFADEASGEWTGCNILHLRKPLSLVAADEGMEESELRDRLASIRTRLLEARAARVRPLLDDKVLTDWNGLMIAALSRAARAFRELAYRRAAGEAADFLLATMRDEAGRLLHRYRDGEAGIRATADDYAYLVWGLIELFQTDSDPRYLTEALRLNDEMLRDFEDAVGGFHLTAADAEPLPIRPKEVYDGALPSANSVAFLNLLRLSRLTGRPELEERAARLEDGLAHEVLRAPSAHAFFLLGLDFRVGPSYEVVIAGDPDGAATGRFLSVLGSAYLPNAVVLVRPPGGPEAEAISRVAPYCRDCGPLEGEPAAYVCRDFACRRPTTDPREMLASLEA